MKSEFKLIRSIQSWIPRSLQGSIGIGDDADLIMPRGGEIAVTADAMMEGVDFRLKKGIGFLSPRHAGRKALAINLSDLAAMGAAPLAFTVTLGIPKNFKESWLKKFYEGMVRLAQTFKIRCLGGDITAADRFFVSVTAMGSVAKSKAILRSGAKAGDWIGVTGKLGGSILKHHALFTPRLKESQFLLKFKPSAMIDISDGLLQDLGHILKSSRTGAVLEKGQIPLSADSKKLKGNAFEHACTDGEDFELLFTVPEKTKNKLQVSWKKSFRKVPLSWIGRITSNSQKIEWQEKGKKIPAPQFKIEGYTHF